MSLVIMNFKTLLFLGFASAMPFLLSGCASVTRGSSQALVIESDPSGADVALSNGMTGKTPTSFKVKRSQSLVVKINKAGYEPIETNVTSQLSAGGGAAFAGNVILGGLIGAAIDAGTGAANELKPNPLTVRLVPITVPAPVLTPMPVSIKKKGGY
jgi:hypothetical protein